MHHIMADCLPDNHPSNVAALPRQGDGGQWTPPELIQAVSLFGGQVSKLADVKAGISDENPSSARKSALFTPGPALPRRQDGPNFDTW